MRPRKLIGIAAALLVAVASPASAVDLCFQEFCNDFVYVIRQYRNPSRGKCRTFAAYEASTAFPYVATASVCLNAGGNQLYFAFTLPRRNLSSYLLQATLSYPSLLGQADIHEIKTTQTSTCTSAASAAFCQPAPIP